MVYQFEVGRAYFAAPTMAGPNKIVVACVGRCGSTVVLAQVAAPKKIPIRCYEGCETALFEHENGFDYFVASSVPADMVAAADVMGAVR